MHQRSLRATLLVPLVAIVTDCACSSLLFRGVERPLDPHPRIADIQVPAKDGVPAASAVADMVR